MRQQFKIGLPGQPSKEQHFRPGKSGVVCEYIGVPDARGEIQSVRVDQHQPANESCRCPDCASRRRLGKRLTKAMVSGRPGGLR